MSYQILTRKNYDFYECSSAFQKSIRRNNQKEAVFFGMELYLSGYSNYCWKRLLIIASEDVGTANDNSAILVNTLFQNFKMIAEKCIEEASLPFIHAVIHLCETEKTRIIDKWKIFAFKSNFKPQIPDYALDVHTRKGKIMGRNHKDFLTTGQIIEPASTKVVEEDFLDEFYHQYFTDYADKKVTITGYDKDNVTHKSTKDLDLWRKQNSQTNLF